MVTVRREAYDQIIDDIKPMLPLHWKELALNQDDVPLDPEYEVYRMADKANMLAMFSVRDGEILIGYAIYFVRPHHHYRTTKWAISDIFWLHPDYRHFGYGREMFKGVEDGLREIGVSFMHTTLKIEHPAASFVLESLGHGKIEMGYSKKLV